MGSPVNSDTALSFWLSTRCHGTPNNLRPGCPLMSLPAVLRHCLNAKLESETASIQMPFVPMQGASLNMSPTGMMVNPFMMNPMMQPQSLVGMNGLQMGGSAVPMNASGIPMSGRMSPM
jgi:hypothetical protein